MTTKADSVGQRIARGHRVLTSTILKIDEVNGRVETLYSQYQLAEQAL